GTLLAIAISMVGVAYLALTDAKRRRAFARAPAERGSRVWLARLACFGPGLALVVWGHAAPVIIWAGALTVLGWGVAAASPDHLAAAQARLVAWRWQSGQAIKGLRGQAIGATRGARQLAEGVRASLVRPEAQRIAELEARVAQLEAALLERDLGTPRLRISSEATQAANA
ncbi:MAG: hypothetical protein AAF568_04975, partial [Pseudomonadota bacterium]